MIRIGILMTVVCLGSLQPLAAQAGPVPEACDYAACALRVHGSDLLAGESGEKVAGFGFFSAPDLRELMSVSDSATHYLDVLESNYGSGMLMGTLGFAAGFIATSVGDVGRNEEVRIGVAVSSLVLIVWGGVRVRRSQSALHSAVWWYNRELVESSVAGPSF